MEGFNRKITDKSDKWSILQQAMLDDRRVSSLFGRVLAKLSTGPNDQVATRVHSMPPWPGWPELSKEIAGA